jgi:hypothetical protein
MDLLQTLTELDCSDIPRFSFDGIETLARVVNIHDPDTFTIVFEHYGKLIKTNVRLEGIDAPELHSTVQAESQACLNGINFLQSLIGDKVVKVILGKFDKFGRVLCTIYSLEQLDDGTTSYQYVRPYHGDKKLAWSDEEINSVGTKIDDIVTTIEIQPTEDSMHVERKKKKNKRVTV